MKVLTEPRRRVDERREKLTEIGNRRKSQRESHGAEEYNYQIEKYTREVWQQTRWSRRISDLEDSVLELIRTEQQKEKIILKSAYSLTDL